MANNSEVTLIHANWCGHCTRYLPKWNDSISSILQKNGIQAGQLEQSDSNFESLSKIDGTPVRGFPTLKVKVNNIEKEFNGNRDNAQEIVDFVKTLQSSQTGGGELYTEDLLRDLNNSLIKSQNGGSNEMTEDILNSINNSINNVGGGDSEKTDVLLQDINKLMKDISQGGGKYPRKKSKSKSKRGSKAKRGSKSKRGSKAKRGSKSKRSKQQGGELGVHHVDLLKHKIAKYEHKYNELQHQKGGSCENSKCLDCGNMSREQLEYKIAKYEHKYNKLSNQSGGNMSREQLEYKIAKYEHKMNQLTNQDGGSVVGIN